MADPERLGKYEIKGALGKGAMGVVYKGFDPQIERHVAIKTIRKDLVEPELADQYMARLRNEAKAAGRLNHPNIVGVYEFGEDETVAFIAMEYVEGTGLREYLNRRASFDFAQLVALMSQLLAALDFAHGSGVVHRDIKPSNLIVTNSGRAQGRRLRHRARGPVEPDHRGHRDRHAVVHVARAVPRPRRRSPFGPLQRRRGPLRAADGRKAVSRDSRSDRLRDLQRASGAAVVAVEAQAAAGGRQPRGDGARQGPRRALPQRACVRRSAARGRADVDPGRRRFRHDDGPHQHAGAAEAGAGVGRRHAAHRRARARACAGPDGEGDRAPRGAADQRPCRALLDPVREHRRSGHAPPVHRSVQPRRRWRVARHPERDHGHGRARRNGRVVPSSASSGRAPARPPVRPAPRNREHRRRTGRLSSRRSSTRSPGVSPSTSVRSRRSSSGRPRRTRIPAANS